MRGRWALVCVVVALLGAAPPVVEKLTPERRKELEAELKRLNETGDKLYYAGKLAEAAKNFAKRLDIARRLHGDADHLEVVGGLNDLGIVLRSQGRLAEAEPIFRDALAMRRRLFKGDHPDVSQNLHSLGRLLEGQGKWAEAEALYRDDLAMLKRLYRGDHAAVAQSLHTLGHLLYVQGKPTEAEAFAREALAIYRRLFKGDHPDVARSLNSLGILLQAQGRLAEAEALSREALAVRRRLFKRDHPDLARSLVSLGSLLASEGRLAEAEAAYREALAMHRRLFKRDHPDLALSLNNLGLLLVTRGSLLAEAETHLREGLTMIKRIHMGDHHHVAFHQISLGWLLGAKGKSAEGAAFFRESLAMLRRLADEYAGRKSDGEALTLAASFPRTRDGLLSFTRAGRSDSVDTYVEVWSSKAAVARVFERRHLAARAASTDPKAAALLAELAAARRRRAELLLAPRFRDPATQKKRDDDLQALTDRVAELDRAVRPLLPAIDRADKLAKATPSDLQKALPADAAVVDFLAYTFFEHDKDKPGKAGEKSTPSYLAFVLTRDRITRVELGPAKPIEEAVRLWRDAITGPSGRIPADIPAKVRELVWAKVRKELPAATKAVYLSPDLALTALPWAALPGDRPGTVLLEDYALAVIPHAPFLLDKLWPDGPGSKRTAGLLAVGGVGYADTPAKLAAKPDERLAFRSGPALKEGQPLSWKPLLAAAAEAKGVASLAERRKLVPLLLSGKDASADRVLAELPRARFAHLATHGFFADKEFRSVLQVDPKLFEMRGGERVGAGALSPMVMSGLVFAGANKPDTPGRGLLTGEALIDRDLSGLELAVLSACETGLGDVAGGEGVFGLQRAFHVAGCRDVVATLWKVDDAATAALMAVFYKKLWQDNLPPVEALRQAQLEVYRNPGKVAELAKGLRGKFEVVPGSGGSGEAPAKPAADGKAHPRLWAAFLLSGPGR